MTKYKNNMILLQPNEVDTILIMMDEDSNTRQDRPIPFLKLYARVAKACENDVALFIVSFEVEILRDFIESFEDISVKEADILCRLREFNLLD